MGPSRVLGIHCTKPTEGTTEMMTQEEFMDVTAMKRQGLSIKEIAEETGYHPSTISSWLKNGGPPTKRSSPNPPVIDEVWSARIAELVRAAPRLLATSVFELNSWFELLWTELPTRIAATGTFRLVAENDAVKLHLFA